MMKRLILIGFLGIFFFGCKAKKNTTYGKSKQKTVAVRESDDGKKYNSKGSFPLPKDTGRFQKFAISSVDEYLDTFSEIAQYEMKAYGIPASITLAQGLLESGIGKGELTVKTNNHFGIKCHKGWKGDYDFHDDDEKGECFRKYNHPMYSYRDHSEFLSTRSRYAFLFSYGTKDYKRWAKGLRQAGYATDKRYPQKLIYLIEKHQLFKFDKANAGNRSMAEVKPQPKQFTNKVHEVIKGDTLYSISRKYYMSVDELKRLNKMNSNNLAIGQQLKIKTELTKK